jgi:N utilization substance protein A
MARVTLDTEKIRMITLFENVTKSRIRDCMTNDNSGTVCFVVEEGKIGVAIGKDGRRVKKVERMIGKNIKLFEYSKDISTFVKNVIPQAKAIKVVNENGRKIVEIKVEKKDRPFVIGRDRKNLNFYKELLHRSHNVDDLVIR